MSSSNSNGNQLFVGGLDFSVNEDDLRKSFEECGNIVSLKLIMDRITGKSKGFCFIEMSSPEEAQKAIEVLDGTELNGRALRVSIARPRL